MRILILAAFENELETIAKHFDELKEIIISKCRCTRAQYNHHDIILSLTGIGTSAATITTTLLCEALKPDLILFCGVAGGLKAEQQIGDLILANKIIDIDLHQLPRLIQDTPYAKALKDPHLLTTIDFEYTPLPSITTTISQLKIDHLKLGTIVTSNI
ncbi:MAG: hypothetical protein LCH30_11110, partial [Proteobacteria bacterium]|nr:hypothetical protein [Pseudomonadota bacterium]